MIEKREGIGLKGHIVFELYDSDKNLKDYREVDNMIVNTGIQSVARLIVADVSEDEYGYIAIGEGTTPPAAGDTTLEDESHRLLASGSIVTTSGSIGDDTAQFIQTFDFGGTFAITESGLLNAAVDGSMLARQTFAVINVISGDSLQVTWKIQVAR